MQIEIEVANTYGAATLTGRVTSASGASPMLGPCTAPGCATIVFGRGTCVAHDPPSSLSGRLAATV
jgi:hypothetical protein